MNPPSQINRTGLNVDKHLGFDRENLDATKCNFGQSDRWLVNNSRPQAAENKMHQDKTRKHPARCRRRTSSESGITRLRDDGNKYLGNKCITAPLKVPKCSYLKVIFCELQSNHNVAKKYKIYLVSSVSSSWRCTLPFPYDIDHVKCFIFTNVTVFLWYFWDIWNGHIREILAGFHLTPARPHSVPKVRV